MNTVQLNLRSVFMASQAAAKHMAAQGGGSTHGEVQVVLTVAGAVAGVQLVGQGLAHVGRTLGGGVAVEGHGVYFVHQLADGQKNT